jgi:hypothetical protein
MTEAGEFGLIKPKPSPVSFPSGTIASSLFLVARLPENQPPGHAHVDKVSRSLTRVFVERWDNLTIVRNDVRKGATVKIANSTTTKQSGDGRKVGYLRSDVTDRRRRKWRRCKSPVRGRAVALPVRSISVSISPGHFQSVSVYNYHEVSVSGQFTGSSYTYRRHCPCVH